MKLKSCALSSIVAASQLLFGVYQTQLKAGDCYSTFTRYASDTLCNENCNGGSGSCLSSYQKKYNPNVQTTRCLPGRPSGFISCEPGPEEVVGTKWKCSSELNSKALAICISSAAVMGIGAIAAVVATEGTVILWGMTSGQVLGFAGLGFGSIGVILGCDYCSTHTCTVSPFEPGELLKESISVKTKGRCPIPSV